MNYYEVKVKCGHVGRHNYIIKKLYIKADDGKNAAKIARLTSRVKHDHKDAIRDVKRISEKEYEDGLANNQNDNYFKVHNSTDQRKYCSFLNDEIIREPEREIRKKYSHSRKRLIEIECIKEMLIERNYIYEY